MCIRTIIHFDKNNYMLLKQLSKETKRTMSFIINEILGKELRKEFLVLRIEKSFKNKDMK